MQNYNDREGDNGVLLISKWWGEKSTLEYCVESLWQKAKSSDGLGVKHWRSPGGKMSRSPGAMARLSPSRTSSKGSPTDENLAGFPDTVSIFPPLEGEMDLADYPPVVVAQRDVQRLQGNTKEEEVNVVIDDEVDDQVVELLGQHANLGFHLEDIDLPFMVLHVKNMQRFFKFECVLQSKDNHLYHIIASNRQTVVRAQKRAASLPIILSEGWNRICLDFGKICLHAFGTQFHAIKHFRIYANCRIWRLFFQDKDYGDASLPIHLRIVQP